MWRFKNGMACLVKFQRTLSLFPSALATSVKLTLYQSSELLWLKMHLKPKTSSHGLLSPFPSSARGVKSLAHPCLFHMWIPVGTESRLTVILALGTEARDFCELWARNSKTQCPTHTYKLNIREAETRELLWV